MINPEPSLVCCALISVSFERRYRFCQLIARDSRAVIRDAYLYALADRHQVDNRALGILVGIVDEIAERADDQLRFACVRQLVRSFVAHVHKRIRENCPDKNIPVCYYLYSLEGALTDTHWDELPQAAKDQLRADVEKQAMRP